MATNLKSLFQSFKTKIGEKLNALNDKIENITTGGISADVGNSIVPGTDDLPYYKERTAEEIGIDYEGLADTNKFTDGEKATIIEFADKIIHSAEELAKKLDKSTYTGTAQDLENAIAGNTAKFQDYLLKTMLGAANGVTPLDAGGKVPFSHLPASLLIYKGVWNADTNTPTLADGSGTAGWAYKVTGAPTPINVNLGSGNIEVTNGDYIIYNPDNVWEKSDGTDAVVSVNGKQGVVTITIADIANLQDALNSKEDSFSKNTAFNKNFGTTAGKVAQGNDPRINHGETAYGWGNDYVKTSNSPQAIDPDLLFDQSSYRLEPHANLPTNDYYSVITYGNASNITSQIATKIASGETYIRTFNTSWSPWQEIATQDWVELQGYLKSYDETDTLDSVVERGGFTDKMIGVLQDPSSPLYSSGTRITEDGIYIGFRGDNEEISIINSNDKLEISPGNLMVIGDSAGANTVKLEVKGSIILRNSKGQGEALIFGQQLSIIEKDFFAKKLIFKNGLGEMASVTLSDLNEVARVNNISNYPLIVDRSGSKAELDGIALNFDNQDKKFRIASQTYQGTKLRFFLPKNNSSIDSLDSLVLMPRDSDTDFSKIVAELFGRLKLNGVAQNNDEAANLGQTLKDIRLEEPSLEIVAENHAGDEISRMDLSFVTEFQPFQLQDKFTYKTGAQVFPLDFEVTELQDVFVNGTRLDRNEYKYTYKQIEVLAAMTANDKVVVQYTTPMDMSQAYGVKKDKTAATPDWERIGMDMTLHQIQNLPVQSKMRQCVLKDDGTVNYYLDDLVINKKEDGTPSDLTGTDGQFMVEIPRHFQRFDTKGNTLSAWISLIPFAGCFEIPKQYVSAGKANLDRAANKLSCVINVTPNFRGGNDQSPWDSESRSQLGRAVTNKSRTEFKTAAQNRGEGWDMMNYEVRRVLYWLITIEFATSYHQKPRDIQTFLTGLSKGGLGEGLTTIDSTQWSNFNSYYPLVKIGDAYKGGYGGLDRKTREQTITLQDFPTTGETTNVKVNSYRGIENFFGDLWEWTDGINIDRQATQIKAYKSIGDAHSDTNFAGYKPMPNIPNDNGYIKDIVFGKRGDILPTSSAGGSATTFYTDYLYTSASEGVRGLLFGGSASRGALAGSLCAASSRAPSSSYAYIGSRLCFLAR